MHNADLDAEPQFAQPIQQILTMFVIIGLVGTGAWLAYQPILEVVMSNIYLNGVIISVFIIGIITCLWQVFGLINSVNWIEGFAMSRPGHEFVQPPRLLVSLATLLKSRSARMQISASSSRSILDSMATRLDETREITRYIINLLIFLGLLGTFYGLATTVPAVVDTIRSLAPSEGDQALGAEVFGRLLTGLEAQLGGMGTAFSSSLLGLAGSLVVGLMDLFTGHGQNRFYRDLEEWLSTITQVGLSAGDGDAVLDAGNFDASGLDLAFHRMAESIDAMHQSFIRSEDSQMASDNRIAELTQAITVLGQQATQPANSSDNSPEVQLAIEEQNALLARIAAGQEAVAAYYTEQGEESVDAESRMRLRSIDVQLLRILEEMSAGRQDTIAELRADIAALNKSIRALGRKPPQQGRS